MDVLRDSSGLEQNQNTQVNGNCSPSSQSTSAPFFKTFRTIPPERVGFNGEYDHNGLAKRVTQALTQNFKPEEIGNLRVKQRGAVVVLIGQVSNHRLLNRLVSISLSATGAADVEVNGVSVTPICKFGAQASYAEVPSGNGGDRRFGQPSYAC